VEDGGWVERVPCVLRASAIAVLVGAIAVRSFWGRRAHGTGQQIHP
jgi:hypothetical protein